MNEQDFTISGMEFKIGKIDAFKQFHVARRIGPIIGDLIPMMQKAMKTIAAAGSMTEEQKFGEFAELVSPVMLGLAKLSDADANHVLLGLLSAVQIRQVSGNWARISDGQLMMIQNLELPVILQVAGRALAFNMSGFFSSMPQVSQSGTPKGI